MEGVIGDPESARPKAARHTQDPQTESLIFVQSRPVERKITIRQCLQIRGLCAGVTLFEQ